MSHPCAKFLEYLESMVDCASFIFEILKARISKTRHPCAFLQSLSENIDHSLQQKFSWGPATMKAPWRCQVDRTLAPCKISNNWDIEFCVRCLGLKVSNTV